LGKIRYFFATNNKLIGALGILVQYAETAILVGGSASADGAKLVLSCTNMELFCLTLDHHALELGPHRYEKLEILESSRWKQLKKRF
jgi:hypothetical protein